MADEWPTKDHLVLSEQERLLLQQLGHEHPDFQRLVRSGDAVHATQQMMQQRPNIYRVLSGGQNLSQRIREVFKRIMDKLRKPETLRAITKGLVVFATTQLGFNFLGFGALGPVSGTLAPWLQSLFGGIVPAGGRFAALQSAGMRGFLPVITGGISAVAGIVAAFWDGGRDVEIPPELRLFGLYKMTGYLKLA